MSTILTSKMNMSLTSSGSSRRLHISRETLLAMALIVLTIIFASRSEFFLSERNMTTILRNSVDLSVICAGMTIVIILGGIDVSVGGILAVVAVLIGRAYQMEAPDWLVIIVGLSAGAALGAINGTIITKTRVPPIVATLGTMYIFMAILFLVIGGVWISGLPNTLSFLVIGSFLGLPVGLYVIGVIYLVSWLLLRLTPWGQRVVAIGCDEGSARLVGIPVDRTKIQAYALLGIFAGIAAVLYVARMRNVEVNIGTNIAMEAIAATILGGANIRGGKGSLIGALMGVLFIKMTQNGLVLIGVSSLWETVVIGGLLVIVLILDAFETRRTA
ncbi:ABC transporter permease [Paracoccus gahaiensis]|uniref:ABC transporter permease n=1 Tax=Paracoccus gahaiensis TaxID=1706839 RepID=A0A4U0R5F3_9RHOB|nr:ABC transporter permease [Paracoccus gahaiensis]TJZ90181.1 ABC transporter permease [Paracoccus gahaiensis]